MAKATAASKRSISLGTGRLQGMGNRVDLEKAIIDAVAALVLFGKVQEPLPKGGDFIARFLQSFGREGQRESGKVALLPIILVEGAPAELDHGDHHLLPM